MVKRERVKKAIEIYGKPIPSTYEAFDEYFSAVLMKNLMDGHNTGDASKHLNPDQDDLLQIARRHRSWKSWVKTKQ